MADGKWITGLRPDMGLAQAARQVGQARLGAARDWDVFLIALRERAAEAGDAEAPGIDCLVGYALGQRHAAQLTLEAVEQSPLQPFGDFMTGLLDQVREPDEERRMLLGGLA